MKTLFKFTALVLAIATLFSFAACSQPKEKETTAAATTSALPDEIRIATLKGPTGMGMAKMIDDNPAGGQYAFTIESDPSAIAPLITTGAVDIAACPLNLAATLYKKTGGKIKMLAVNTLGVLYILEKGQTFTTVSELKGKTIVASGQGATPEYVLNYILKANGLDPAKDVNVEYKAEHSEVAALAASGKADICMLPEPFVTTVTGKNPALRIALDLTALWETAARQEGKESKLAMGCIIAAGDFADKYPAAVDAFLAQYKASVNYVNANPAQAASLIAKQGIIPDAALAEKAIPRSQLTFLAGSEMKAVAMQNFRVLFAANPASIGGAIPGSDFFWGA